MSTRRKSLVVPLGVAALLVAGAVLAAALATNAAGAGRRAADSLNLHAVVAVTAHSLTCPPNGPPDPHSCYAFQGSANVPGLGHVTYTRGMTTLDAEDGSNTACGHVLFGPIAMNVAGKGAIDFSVSVDPGCNGVPTGFAVTGGTGDFVGASGSGTFVPNIVQSGHWVDEDDNNIDSDDILSDWRFETWAGSLALPNHVVDLTPPVISGAHSRTVTAPRGAKRVHVRFTVKANDAVDGPVHVSCKPHSGSLFPIGRTRVKCSAADTSANTAHARFTIVV